MKRTFKKSKPTEAEILYDDDTDSSDSDNLQSFHQDYMARNKTGIRKYSSSDADDEVNENTSDDDETSETSSNSSSDNEVSSEDVISSDQTIQKHMKLESLQNRLKSLDKANYRAKNLSGQKETPARYADPSGPENTANSDLISERITTSSKSSENENTSSTDRERLEIRKELSQMSMEEILQLKEKLGSKLYNRALSSNCSLSETKGPGRKKDEMKRDNKNRPREMSSKKTVKRLRDVVGVSAENKHEKRDPRFDSMCGEFDEKIHRDAYKFVDDIKAKELGDLKKELNGEDDPEKIKQIKYLIQRLENQNREKKKVENLKQSERERKKRNRELVKEGKAPEFVSRQEEKNKTIVEKYEELKSTNKLEQYMKKKNKKNLVKERKRLKTFEM